MKSKHYKEIRDYILDNIKEYEGISASELHHNLFNTDYYIIGTYDATKWLEEYNIFDAFNKIKEYEQDNFGNVITDFGDPEKVVNMLAYIIGEEILNESDHLREIWDQELTKQDIEKIKEELE